jgi:hypothetical protein
VAGESGDDKWGDEGSAAADEGIMADARDHLALTPAADLVDMDEKVGWIFIDAVGAGAL